MNLAQYLNQTVTPLSDYLPTPHHEKPRKPGKKPDPNQTRHQKCVERYRTFMGDRWVTTREVDDWLGWKRGGGEVLNRWRALGIVECRRAGRGYEWRMK